MSYKISVIVPCYNAEDTLVRCVESVINQSFGFENIELILYDDASKDNTRDIILEYSDKYENIISILSDINTGQGIGRNKCMDIASGEYLMFLDSDDEYSEDMCKVLFNEIQDSNIDLVTCSFINHRGSKTNNLFHNYSNGICDGDKVIFNDENVFYLINWVVWLCIFKRNIVNRHNLYFSSNAGEDMHFLFQYLLHINKSVYLKNFFGVLRYTQEDSISYSYTITDLNEFLDLTIDSINLLKDKNIDFSYVFNQHMVFMIYQIYISNNHVLNNKNDVINFLKRLSSFEKKYKFNFNLGFLQNMLNKLILKDKYYLAFIYLKVLEKSYRSTLLKNIYSKL